MDKETTCVPKIKIRVETMGYVNNSRTIRASNHGVRTIITTTRRLPWVDLDRVCLIRAMGVVEVDSPSNSKQHNRSPTFSEVREVALKRTTIMEALARESNLNNHSLRIGKVPLDLRFKATNFNHSMEWVVLAQVSVEPSASSNHNSNFKLLQRHQEVMLV